MVTDSLYLALLEEDLFECVLPSKRGEWNDKRESGLFKEKFRCTETLFLCSKFCCCYDGKPQKNKFSSKGLNKRTLDVSGDGPMAKYRHRG